MRYRHLAGVVLRAPRCGSTRTSAHPPQQAVSPQQEGAEFIAEQATIADGKCRGVGAGVQPSAGQRRNQVMRNTFVSLHYACMATALMSCWMLSLLMTCLRLIASIYNYPAAFGMLYINSRVVSPSEQSPVTNNTILNYGPTTPVEIVMPSVVGFNTQGKR